MCEWDESGLADTYEVDPSEVVCNEEDSIGDGNFGKVWLGTFQGQAVAIKTMKSSYWVHNIMYMGLHNCMWSLLCIGTVSTLH